MFAKRNSHIYSISYMKEQKGISIPVTQVAVAIMIFP
jgi:hypothetical protein